MFKKTELFNFWSHFNELIPNSISRFSCCRNILQIKTLVYLLASTRTIIAYLIYFIPIIKIKVEGWCYQPMKWIIWSIIRYRALLHTMAWCYVIYRYVISKWRSIRPVEINHYDITTTTHYDITMGNDIARDVYCEITMGNDIARNIHCDVTMSNDVTICTYGIIMQLSIMNLFYYVFSALCLIMILLWVVCNKNKN